MTHHTVEALAQRIEGCIGLYGEAAVTAISGTTIRLHRRGGFVIRGAEPDADRVSYLEDLSVVIEEREEREERVGRPLAEDPTRVRKTSAYLLMAVAGRNKEWQGWFVPKQGYREDPKTQKNMYCLLHGEPLDARGIAHVHFLLDGLEIESRRTRKGCEERCATLDTKWCRSTNDS